MNKESSGKLRIDKYLWCIRVYKSRTLATQACEGGKVKINGERVKPSRPVKAGEVITVQQGFIKKSYKVLELLNKRVSAKLVVNYADDVTPPEEKEKALISRFVSYQSKYSDTGRPTKKDRRLLQKFRGK
jgi:ribosome-associated heat shock protein Hsp15